MAMDQSITPPSLYSMCYDDVWVFMHPLDPGATLVFGEIRRPPGRETVKPAIDRLVNEPDLLDIEGLLCQDDEDARPPGCEAVV